MLVTLTPAAQAPFAPRLPLTPITRTGENTVLPTIRPCGSPVVMTTGLVLVAFATGMPSPQNCM